MVKIYKHSGIYSLIAEQEVDLPIDKCWNFFSKPDNLQIITPDYMGFNMTSPIQEDSMYAGQIISYKVAPVAGIRMNWVTEITHVQEGRFFVDEQRFGPYRFWHHQHHFIEKGSGTVMKDIVSYKLPLGFLGRIGHSLLVKPKLLDIFEYRKKAVHQIVKQI